MTKFKGKFFSHTLMIMMLLASCQSGADKDDSIPEGEFVTAPETITNVNIITLQLQDFTYTITSMGKLKAQQDQVLRTDKEQILKSKLVENGYKVHSGQALVYFDNSILKSKLLRDSAKQFNALKEYESLLIGYEKLLEKTVPAERILIKKKLKISSGLVDAELDIRSTKAEISKSVIRAPFGGIISDCVVQGGEALKPGQELLRVYDPNTLYVEVKILESDLSLVRKNTSVIINVLSSAKAIYASVSEVNPYVDQNGLVTIKIKIAGSSLNDNVLLFPGMNCTTSIKIAAKKAIVVPKDAIVNKGGKNVIFTEDRGFAKWHEVNLGRENGLQVEVIKGLKLGEKVIVSNNLQLAQNTQVRGMAIVER